jgi:hypothetical protein
MVQLNFKGKVNQYWYEMIGCTSKAYRIDWECERGCPCTMRKSSRTKKVPSVQTQSEVRDAMLQQLEKSVQLHDVFHIT